MKTVKISILLGLLLVISVTTAYGASDWTSYKYQREVQPPVSGFIILDTDDNMLNNTRPGLGDIRIFDRALREIPYKIYTSPVYRYESYSPGIINSVQHGDEHDSLTLDLGDSGPLTNKLTLSADNSLEYISKVVLYAGNDNLNWVKIKEDRIVNLKSPQAVTINDINYGNISYRYIKADIYRYNGIIPAVSGVTIYFEPHQNDTLGGTRPLMITARGEAKENKTVITADSGAKDMSISSLEFSVSGKNYRRDITVEGSYNNKDWSYIANGVIFNYNWDGYRYNSPSIPIPNSNTRYFRITIDNHDNEPLSISGIQSRYNPPRILIEAEKNELYSVYYGYDNAAIPDYDLSSFAHLIDTSKLPRIGMSGETPNKGYKAPPEPQKPWSDTHKWVLTLTLIVLVAVMGFFMVRSFRRETDGGD